MTGSAPLWPEKSRSRVTEARVARLSSVRPDGRPHLVPVTYALDGDALLTPVDHKPKSTTALQRLANIEHQPQVSVLVDHYDEDWQQLWWVRLDGSARVARDEPGRRALLEPLIAKYAAYRDQPPAGPLIIVTIETVTAWSAT